MKATALGVTLGAISLAAFLPAPCEAKLRVTTLTDNGGPAPGLLSCVGEALPLEEQAERGADDFHAWLFVAKLDGVPVAPHLVHLLLTVDEPETKESEENPGAPVRFLSWRSFQGEATDAAFCADIAQAIRAGVADAGPGVRTIRVK